MIANLLQEAEDAGIVVVAAAGNDAADSCLHWPSSQTTVVSVAALAQGDYRASFSDYGSCVSIFAPGQSVRSTWLNGGTLLLSGTSMASPLAAGVAALLLEQDSSRSPATIRSLLSSEATPNDVVDAQGSPNLIVYANLDSSGGTTSSSSSSSLSSSVSASRAPSPSHSRTPSHSRSRTASATHTNLSKRAHHTLSLAQGGSSSSSSSTGGNVASCATVTHLVMTVLASAAVAALV